MTRSITRPEPLGFAAFDVASVWSWWACSRLQPTRDPAVQTEIALAS